LRKLLIMGLSGAGKTTLAKALAPRLKAVVFNADEVRAHINKDLGFSEPDRIEQARRMGWLCDQVAKTGNFAIADFICPTPATRAAFLEGGDAFVIWLHRIKSGRYEDTNRMFVSPDRVDIEVLPQGSPEYWAEQVLRRVRPDPLSTEADRTDGADGISPFTTAIRR
jgi:adenylylsulfate kinase